MSPLIYLRILGGVVAAGMLVSAVVRRRKGRIPFADALIQSALGLALMALAVIPGVADPFLRVLGFKPGHDQRRIIGVLMVSGIITYVLILLFDRFMLHDEVPLMRWGGVALIIGGILLVSRTPHS